MRKDRRLGFTLVEMLVVVAIIGLLVGLLLPAVMSARENARRMECSAHLKEIGNALQSYHAMYMNFPINYGANTTGQPPDPTNQFSQGRSWMLGLLPSIDEQSLYDKVDFTQPLNYTDGLNPPRKSNLLVAGTVVKLYLCPSDRDGDGTKRTGLDIHRSMPNQPFAVTNFKACAGSNWALGDIPSLFPNERKNYITDDPIADDDQISFWVGRNRTRNDGQDQGNGIICRGNGFDPRRGVPYPLFPTAIRDVTDGASHTLAVGECVPRWCEKSWWYWFDGATATAAAPINYKPDNSDPIPEDINNNQTFMSRHLGGCNFCMVDGSVHFIDEGIDINVLHDLANISDGFDARLPE